MTADGVVTTQSPDSFDVVVERLLRIVQEQGLRVFDVIDHAGAAAEVGLTLRPTKVVVFGSPSAGTPLMDAHPLLALELPLRILVWQDDGQAVQLSCLEAAGLAERFGVPSRDGPLSAPAKLAERAARPD